MQIECQRYMRPANITRVPERESTNAAPKTQVDSPKKAAPQQNLWVAFGTGKSPIP